MTLHPGDRPHDRRNRMGDEGPQDFKTDDMCLVAALKYDGHTPQRIEWEGGSHGKCFWYFMNVSPLREVVSSYLSRCLNVEPRQFNFIFGETKKEFYKLYDEAKKG
jgi:hypothetical protein